MSSENYIIHDQYAVHFLTFTVIDWIDIFTRASYKIEIPPPPRLSATETRG
jgi:hypothetical protein